METWELWTGYGGRRSRSTEIYLDALISSHRGAEAYLERETSMASPSITLIARDPEWTRRSVPSSRRAQDVARRRHLPCYETAVVGYPQRRRDFNCRARGRRSG